MLIERALPQTGGDVPIDPADGDVAEYKRVFRASKSLPAPLVDLACLLLDGGSMEDACRSAWFCGDDGPPDVDKSLDRLQRDAWASLGGGGQAVLQQKGVSSRRVERS